MIVSGMVRTADVSNILDTPGSTTTGGRPRNAWADDEDCNRRRPASGLKEILTYLLTDDADAPAAKRRPIDWRLFHLLMQRGRDSDAPILCG